MALITSERVHPRSLDEVTIVSNSLTIKESRTIPVLTFVLFLFEYSTIYCHHITIILEMIEIAFYIKKDFIHKFPTKNGERWTYHQ